MAKNNSFIELQKKIARLEHYCKELVPEIYSCFCICLFRKGWTHDEIEDLCNQTLELWNENIDRTDDLIKRCVDETGIDVRRRD